MTAEEKLEACRLLYEAYWFSLAGFLNGIKLPCWTDVPQAQKDAMVVGMADVETYIAGLGA